MVTACGSGAPLSASGLDDLPGCGEFGPGARERRDGPCPAHTGVVAGALAGASEAGCAAGLVRQRIDGAVGQ